MAKLELDITEIMKNALEQLQVTEMFLCESAHLLLRPNQLYYFTVDENCEECRKLADNYRQERGN